MAHQDRLYSIALRMLRRPARCGGGGPGRLRPGLSRARRLRPRPGSATLRLRGWLATIVLNCAGRDSAGERRRPRSPGHSTSRCPARFEPRADDRRGGPLPPRVARADGGPDLLPSLRPPTAAAVVLRHVDGLSYPEIAGGPRSTRGHRQGPCPPRPGRFAHRVRGRPAARARGDDRMTDPRSGDRGRPGRPATPAPPRSPGRPGRVGLADHYALFESPIGPLRRRLERAGRVGGRGGRRRRRVRGPASMRTGPAAAQPPDGLPDRPRARHRATAGRRPPGPDRPRPARPHRLRARRLAQGPRDPARRGPAVRLDRRRDRAPEGGPRGRDGARPQPGAR